ncbi:GNAT family N-acetyltransferase [Microbacterium sp. LMI1-1-1.1]|uniref:GNAT family N-acetyltransferase n=1 Tax=Microbacterium sp. LMI1-1-1.1 TaxID=3135223 RepID=UPI003467A8D0
MIEIRPDDLSGAPTRALAAAHLAGMHANTPAESVHALDLDALGGEDVSLFSAWVDGGIAGIGALSRLSEDRAELKSMRVADAHLGRGVGRAMLHHLVAEARARGIRSLWLETGSTDDFLAARRLYASEGFVECPAFPPYLPDPLSTFMTRAL